MSPARLYRLLARAEMITWTLLLVGMAAKYTVGADWATRAAGGIHGLVFLAYALVTVVVAVDHRWPVRDLVLGLGSAVLPFCTVPFEAGAERRGLLDGGWRLLAADGAGPAERVVGWALRRPVAAVAVGLAVVVGAFVVLLRLGPPTRWVS